LEAWRQSFALPVPHRLEVGGHEERRSSRAEGGLTVAETLLQETASPPTAAAPDAGPAWRVVAVEDPDALSGHVAAWEDLAAHALEPNPFYEPWMLVPAWRAFGRGLGLRFVFVYQDEPKNPGRLCGFFPLLRRRTRGVPVLGLWQHLHCFLGTPLLRAGRARECLDALLDWARRDRRGAALLELKQVTAEGPFHRALIEFLYDNRCLTFTEESYVRAFWQPREDAEAYLRAALSAGGRQDFRRKRKRLGELGRLESRVLEPGGDVEGWARHFLELEAAGWKGKEGTALASNLAERDYFLDIARAAAGRGRLRMLGLFLDDRPIALKVNFVAGDGAFVFKTAYDEAFARFSPGALVEIDAMHLCHQETPARWVDSCTAPDHPMWNRLWAERRPIRTLLVSTGRFWGDLAVSLRPLLRWAGRLLRRKP
jgi:CelD/BcsL family acetyltransferase involved in cellulose biosynthesis